MAVSVHWGSVSSGCGYNQGPILEAPIWAWSALLRSYVRLHYIRPLLKGSICGAATMAHVKEVVYVEVSGKFVLKISEGSHKSTTQSSAVCHPTCVKSLWHLI